MSGHSKWATIHRKKGELDQQRGKIFQKIAKEIYVAARGTDGNPDNNPSLRAVLEKARSNNMPKDNIQKAIDKATGALGGEDYESVRYEGYGPNGVAFMVDCLTDNRNRTAGLVRSSFTKKGGNLGTDGSVAYMFERKGVIVTDKSIDEDTAMMVALDNGALDFIVNDDNYEIYTDTENFIAVKDALESSGVKEFITSEITFIASNLIEVDDEAKEKVLGLVEVLEDLDDVQAVYHNLSE
ncbi:MAG: YebC/PmpR family DNA-binding transcriptional regulator [Bacilli bacterium]|nr:YebC/PmpR family DNA-binding transcriptional regulator [Bacilli bacterium]